MSIFAELKQRRFVQIIVTYLAGGWIVLQVFDQLVDRGILPNIAYELALIAYLFGIPAAALIGWFHGEKGAQQAPRSEIVALVALALTFLVLTSFSVSNYRAERMAVTAAMREAGADLNRIAVLYFRDHTPGGEYQHVADGLTESLIDELAAVPALDVVTRNGAAGFRNSDLSRDSIGRALGVGTLVDGTVERSGNRLRVAVRIFDAYSGSEFRSATIEAQPDELLAARDGVVDNVARLLRSWLGEEVRVRQRGQRIMNARAWALHQRAERARKDAESALAHDAPAAAAAWLLADSLAAQAELLAPDWVEPIVLRGTIAYRRSRLAHGNDAVLPLIAEALAHAERALRIAPTDAQALELRGTSRYWQYLRTRDALPHDAPRLLAAARADLERAVSMDPLLAGAHSTLSHLLYRDDTSSAVLAARRAYEADAYLDAAPEVLWRLVAGNYDMENFDQLQRWCDEAIRRFPADYRFTVCQLLLLTTRQAQPDVERAWSLLAQLDTLVPARERAYQHARGTTLVGGAIARASRGGIDPVLADSARSVLTRARALANTEVDPRQELLPQTAYMYTLLGDDGTAIELLRRHAVANPSYSFQHHWWWRELRGKPDFEPLLVNP